MLNVDASFLNYNYDIDIPSFVRSFPGGLSFKNLKLSSCDFDLTNEKYRTDAVNIKVINQTFIPRFALHLVTI